MSAAYKSHPLHGLIFLVSNSPFIVYFCVLSKDADCLGYDTNYVKLRTALLIQYGVRSNFVLEVYFSLFSFMVTSNL
jgi:hypothetical protein